MSYNIDPYITIPQYASLQRMEEYNYSAKTRKEYQKNRNELYLNQDVRGIQMELEAVRPCKYPPFPTQNVQLSTKLLEYTKSHRSGTNFDHVGVLLGVLGAISIATQGKVELFVNENWIESTSLMILLVSDAGTKKSYVISNIRKPFDEFCETYNKKNVISNDASNLLKAHNKNIENQAIKEMKDKISKCTNDEEKLHFIKNLAEGIRTEKIPISQKCKILIDKCTQLGLCELLMSQGGSLGAITSEGDIMNSLVFAKKDGLDFSVINKLHTQEAYVYKSGKNEINLKKPFFSMVNFIQPEIAYELYSNEKFSELGVSARFLPFFFQGVTLYVDSPIPNFEQYNNLIRFLLEKYYTQDSDKPKFQVKLDDEAYHLLNDFKCETEYCEVKEAQPALNKLYGHAVRLAWCIHVLFCNNYTPPHLSSISGYEMQEAISLCKVLRNHIIHAYKPTLFQSRNNAKKILENLKNINYNLGNENLLKGLIDARTIQQRTHIKAEKVTNALYYLSYCNLVRVIDSGTSKDIVVVHPRYRDYKIW